MAPPKDTANGATAPGPRVVEALNAPALAQLVEATIRQAIDALRRDLTVDGRTLTPIEDYALRATTGHGVQLVTATTPVGGPS